MTQEEAYSKMMSSEWKTKSCGSEVCWCAMIVPKDEIRYGKDDVEDIHVIGAGSIEKELAEYIVNLHNKSL